MHGKYIMTGRGPILFPESFRHDDFKEFHPTSAGFFNAEDRIVATWGESLTLKLKPVLMDKEIIQSAFGF